MTMHTRGAAELQTVTSALRKQFLGWQCRIRQFAIRRDAGRPSQGMRPVVSAGGQELGRITVLINKRDAETVAAEFAHVVRKTQDPGDRMEAALGKLAAAYYQRPDEFSDELTALFGAGSAAVQRLLSAGSCTLEFEQANQRYRLPCKVRRLASEEPGFQVTYWHNRMFNPAMPDGVQVIGFEPQWADAEADPSPLG